MNKKIIATVLIFTVLFTCVFAACNTKEEEDATRVYIENDEYDFVTDENGEKVYNEDGEFLVYATNERGKRETNENGENLTLAQPFEAFENEGVYEDYGYKFTLPEGWEATDRKGYFQNPEKQQGVSIIALHETYDECYQKFEAFYKNIVENEEYKKLATASIEKDLDLIDGCTDMYRLTASVKEGSNVIYVFVNNGNLYKIIFETPDTKNAIADSEAMLKAFSYKPYQYYEDIVIDNPSSRETELTTAESTTVKAE